ncbi:MAG: hypothetical protein ACTSPV_00505 [Candidatus Hodarchaeales archaeon]
MKEPGKNILLEKLRDWRWAVQHGHTKRRDFRNWHDDDEQAYQQIRQLIEVCYGCDYFQDDTELYKSEAEVKAGVRIKEK